MSRIILMKKITQEEAQKAYDGITLFFQEHPRRRVCRTDYRNVRRGHVAEDLMQIAQAGVKIKEENS